MKVRGGMIQLGIDGKPGFFFDVEPETELERDALAAMGYLQELNKHDATKSRMIAKVNPLDGSDVWKGMKVWCYWGNA